MDEESPILQLDEHDTRSSGSCCRRGLLFLGRLLLHLGCLGYSLYLIWLLAFLKDNPYYWFISLIPLFFSVLFPLFVYIMERNLEEITSAILNIPIIPILVAFLCLMFDPATTRLFREWINKLLHTPSTSVLLTLMACFTMLTRLAYYHRQPDEFIGPRFIILSLQGSVILILLDFYLQREGKLESLLNCKDTMTRMLLDFVDIFNMVEILSANECVGVGSFVSENGSTERSIQAFCTISFAVVWFALDVVPINPEDFEDQTPSTDNNSEQQKPRTHGELLYEGVTVNSGFYQNLPFFVIRIVVWARYKLYNLGFLVKNSIVIIISIALFVKTQNGNNNQNDLSIKHT